LVAELEFMALLLRKKLYAQENGNREALEVINNALYSFFRDHLGRWYRLFTEILKEQSEEEYYRVMGELLRAFLEKEREGVDGIVDVKTYIKEVLEGSSWKCGF
jgi:TorA maturation chaperone TorD